MLRPEDRPFEIGKIDAVIATGASESAIVDLGGLHLAAILMPAAWTAASITILTSYDGANFFPAYDSAGNEITLTVAASRLVVMDFSQTIALGNHIKLRSGTLALPVNQVAARTLSLIPRSF
jgi:hypothetical protein